MGLDRLSLEDVQISTYGSQFEAIVNSASIDSDYLELHIYPKKRTLLGPKPVHLTIRMTDLKRAQRALNDGRQKEIASWREAQRIQQNNFGFAKSFITPTKTLGSTEVQRYRKLPIVIEAIQWMPNGSNWGQVAAFLGLPESKAGEGLIIDDKMCVKISTLEGDMIAGPGDFIIKGIKGEFYPCKEDIFFKTYELAEDEE